ncbi:DUF401 family protein, partial [candidate division GN15 bacterium]|nr:DUF401 family protein [candidate division GN15 bacterium]
YTIPPKTLAQGYWELLLSHDFLTLTALVIAITALGTLLKELGFLNRLAAACQGLYGGSKTAVAIMPGLVGLMPMPGGSLLSAPLVNSVLNHPRYTPHMKCAANYWFRHLAEFSWPVYAGLILTEAITGLSIARVALLQLPLAVLMFILGLLFFVTRIKDGSAGHHSLWRPLLSIAGSVWPVVLAIVLYGLIGLQLVLSVVISIVLLAIVARPTKDNVVKSFKDALSPKLVLLVFGVLSFQMVIEMSGGVEAISILATDYHLPEELIVFIVLFTIGLLTGMVSAYVGLGYTLVAGLLYQPELQPGLIMLAYLSGFIGIILSPAHLCLILTNNYFGSDIMKVYKELALPLLFLAIGGYLLYLSDYGALFAP